ncbi:hypothetical protein LC612_36695 [Nostoc sp. CHAB 5834]|nr:hypothetical protein [Nostoc sp. CHAB 5834]
MKVKTLLAQASKCKTVKAAAELLEALERAFGAARPLAHLSPMNSEAMLEDDTPFVRFELNKEISEHYITMIRPEIRDGKLMVDVVTNRMLDGLGMSSQSWETVEDMDDTIEAYENDTIAALAKKAKDIAIANHAQLIEQVGVPHPVALKAAQKSW